MPQNHGKPFLENLDNQEALGMRTALRPVGYVLLSRLVGAVRAAVHDAFGFDSMADDAAAAVGAGRSHGVNGAFKTVEGAGLIKHGYGEGFVVLVSAGIADSHDFLPIAEDSSRPRGGPGHSEMNSTRSPTRSFG